MRIIITQKRKTNMMTKKIAVAANYNFHAEAEAAVKQPHDPGSAPLRVR
jgi:hypothetical protein